MHLNDYTTAQSLPWWWCGPSASTRSADVLSSFQFLHIVDLRTVDPLLKDTPDAVVHRIQIWRIGWPHLWRDKLLASLSAACTVNGMISVTSTLRHQVKDVHGTQRSKFTSMISNHLQSCVPKITKNMSIFVKVIVKKSVAPFLCGHGVDALNVLCEQLTRDLFAIAYFFVFMDARSA